VSQHKFHSELDKPRIVDRIIHDSKASRLKEGLWRAKLRTVEEVEELSPELEAHSFGRAEGRSFEYGEIEIDDTLLAQTGSTRGSFPKTKSSGCEKQEVLNHAFSLDSGLPDNSALQPAAFSSP